MSGKRYEIDMCSGPLASKILRFAMPLMLAGIIQLLFNAADVVVVGKFVNATAQGAVTSTGSMVNLLIGVFTGMSVGVNVIVARALGEGETSRIHAVVHTSVALGLIGGIALMIVGEFLAPIALRWMGSPPEVIGLSTTYLRVYFTGLPGSLLYNFGSALLRARGDTKRPMYFLTLAGVVNVVLNLIFVVIFRWDVAGVAAATSISKYVSAVLVLYCLKVESGPMHLDLRQLKVDWGVFREIAGIGVPAGVQGSLFSLSNVTLQSAVNSLGAMAVAGVGAASSIAGFVYTTGNAFYQAAMTFTSQNYGAGKMKRVGQVHRWCLLFGVLFPLVLGLLGWLFREELLSIYLNKEDAEAMAWGSLRISCVLVFYWLSSVMEVNSGMLRGIGYSVLPMVVTLLGTCVLRVGWAVFVFPLNPTLEVLSACLPVSWALTGAVHWICYFALRKKAFARRVAELAQQEQAAKTEEEI